MTHRTRSTAGALAAVLALAACADPTQPTPTPSATLDGDPGKAGYVDVCKSSGPANIAYHFTVTVAGGTGYGLPSGSSFDLLVGQCKAAWIGVDPASAPSIVTISEVDLPAGVLLDRMEAPWSTAVTGSNWISVTARTGQYDMVKVHNKAGEIPPPPPPTGVFGCTPGYWKQPQHFGNWIGYSQTQLYREAFGVNALSRHLTLLAALEEGGGNGNRFGRHSTAALLNASRLGSGYGMSTAEVIAAVQAAVAGGSTQMDALASRFEGLNERSCPLGRAE